MRTLVLIGFAFAVLSCRERGAATEAPDTTTPQVAAPTPSATAGKCFDSDVGAPDPRVVAGYVLVTDASGTATRVDDACENEHYVREGRCPEHPTSLDAQLGYYFLAYCANGCRDGACVP